MLPSPTTLAATFAAFTTLTQALVDELPRNGPEIGLSPRQAAIQFSGTSEGCYSSPPGGWVSGGSDTYQSSGWCGKKCTEMGYPVMALQDSRCLCGDRLPSTSSSTSEASCNFFCPGYDVEPCGGTNAYTVWLTGVPGNFAPEANSNKNPTTSQTTTSSSVASKPTHSHSSSSNSRPKHSSNVSHRSHTSHTVPPKTSTVIESQTTTVRTVTGSTGSPNSKQDTSSNKSTDSSSLSGATIAVIVGVVAGVVVFASLVALLLFYLRRRRRMKNAENGHRRADSLNAFVASGGHMPGSMADRLPAKGVDDCRLDPSIMRETRRESVGSFLADNRDYSRRILTVTNPDGT